MNSTEIISPDGQVEKSPYCLLAYYCIIRKMTRRKLYDDCNLIEPLLDKLQMDLEWCEVKLKKRDKKIYTHDKTELEGYVREVLRFYQENNAKRCGFYLKTHWKLKKYLKTK